MTEPRQNVPVDALARDDGTIDGGAILRLLNRPLTDEDLRDATERIARPLAPSEGHVVSLLLFHAGNELLALPAIAVVRVTRLAAVRRIPHRSNKFIRGLCNIEGDLVICGSLIDLLELGDEPADADEDAGGQTRRMIVMGEENRRWVMEVDSVEGIVYVDPQSFNRPPITVECALHRYTDHLVPTNKSPASLLSAEKILSGFQAALS